MNIELNVGPTNYIPETQTSEIVAVAVSELVSVPASIRQLLAIESSAVEEHRRGLVKWTRHAVRANQAGNLRMSLAHFRGVGSNITNTSAEVIVRESKLGRHLENTLQDLDVYEKTFGGMGPQNQAVYRRVMTLLLAGLCMSSTGAKTIDELGPDRIFSWLYAYRDESKDRFHREEFWKSNYNIASKCLKQLAIAFGKYFGSSAISDLSAVVRQPDPGKYSLRTLFRAPPEHLKPWVVLWEKYRSTKNKVMRGAPEAFRLLAYYLDFQSGKGVDISPTVFMYRARTPSFASFTRNGKGGPPPASWIGFFSELQRFSDFLGKEFRSQRTRSEFAELLSEEEKARLKNDVREAGKTSTLNEAAAMALPMRYYNLHREILLEGENGWPGTHPFCQTIVNKKQIYCPVLADLYLSMHELPERLAQLKRLDSGEGDPELFNARTMKWEKNAGPLAGYWARLDKKQASRGYACKTDDPKITGFRINTNKTGDPFVVPWQNNTLHKILYDLRLWQEKWNPVTFPIGPRDYVDNADGAEEGALKGYPSIFSLFRMPDTNGKPPSERMKGQFWLDSLLEVQNRWNATCDPEDRAELVTLGKNGQPEKSEYGSHGMRVAGLTLLLQAGVPLEVVSRLIAGHKTLLMTLYYMKVEPRMITNILDEARIKISAARTTDAIHELKSMSFENAKRRSVSTHPDALFNAMPENGGSKILWADRDYGICPWEGTRCEDGGELLSKSSKYGKVTVKYGPVEGRSDSCVLCRHFLTGPEWEEGLFAYGTLIARRLSNTGARINDLQSESRSLHIELQAKNLDEQDRIRLKRDLKRTDQSINDSTMKQTTLSKAFVQTNVLLEKIDRLVVPGKTANKDKRKSLIAHRNTSVVEWLEVSEFEQTAFLAKYGQLHKSLFDPEVMTSLHRIVDEIAVRSLYEPIYMGGGTEAQKSRRYHAAVDLLLERVSKADLEGLSNGRLTFRDLGIDAEVEKLWLSFDTEGESLLLPPTRNPNGQAVRQLA